MTGMLGLPAMGRSSESNILSLEGKSGYQPAQVHGYPRQTQSMDMFFSHLGSPPKSHSEQMYGPGLTITYKPNSCANLIKALLKKS